MGRGYKDQRKGMIQNVRENHKIFWRVVNRCRREVCVQSEGAPEKCRRLSLTIFDKFHTCQCYKTVALKAVFPVFSLYT